MATTEEDRQRRVGATDLLRQIPNSPSPAQVPAAAAAGGAVGDRAQQLIAQIPTGGMRAPAADGSQNNPLNSEVGRNAMNTLAALPGAAGFTARAGGGAARAAGGALSSERVIPAAWEIVQDGGALARTGGNAVQQLGQIGTNSSGALSRAANLPAPATAIGNTGRATQILGAPPSGGGQLANRAASEVGEALPGVAYRARGATPYADVVAPAALAAPTASAAGSAAAGGLGRLAGVGAAGLGAAAFLGSDAPRADVYGSQPVGSVGDASDYANSTPLAAPSAAATLAGPPMSASGSITRDGNSYSGAPNIMGDVTFRNPNGSVRQAGGSVTSLPAGSAPSGFGGAAAAQLGVMPGQAPGISAQNMGAADALAARGAAESMGRLMASGQIATPAAGPSLILPGSTGFRRDSRFLAQELGAQRALDYAQGNDPASRARSARQQLATIQEQGANARAVLADQGADRRQAVQEQGLNLRQLIEARRSGQPPAGYRWAGSGGLEAIPGGPAAAKVDEEQKTRDSALDASRQTIGTINRLLASPGREGATGSWNLNRFIPGTSAADFATEVETLKAQTFLPMVQQLRGMGALSNAEGDKLNAAVGALNFNMSEKAFQESLGRIRDQFGAALQRSGVDTKDVANWGLEAPSSTAEPGARSTGAAAAPGQPLRVESQQAFAALPSGSRFVAPDGTVRVKP